MRTLPGILLVVTALAVGVVLAVMYGWDSVRVAGGETVQPLAFSHALHAGALEIDCRYCHRHATESAVAGVPTVRLCTSCHRAVKTETPETEALMRHAEEDRPIHWVRRQRLPDHVYFTHEMHVQAGVTCRECHGRVEEAAQTWREPRRSMGWCLSCHGERADSRDCWTCHK